MTVADASMASMTSSSDLASAWMSSRSIGVTNVRVQPLDDLVRQVVALVLDVLDLVGLAQITGSLCEHLLRASGADAKLSRQRAELVVKVFVSGN